MHSNVDVTKSCVGSSAGLATILHRASLFFKGLTTNVERKPIKPHSNCAVDVGVGMVFVDISNLSSEVSSLSYLRLGYSYHIMCKNLLFASGIGTGAHSPCVLRKGNYLGIHVINAVRAAS